MEIEDKFLNSTNCKDGDIVVILDAGTKEVIEDKFHPGRKKTVYNFNVSLNEKTFLYSPNMTTLKSFIKAWGKETNNWIGKKFQIKLALTTSGKYAIMPVLMEEKV